MSDDQLVTMQPREVTSLARKIAELSPEHALALLDGVAASVIKTDRTCPRETQMMSGEQLAFGMRLVDAIGMLRAIVGRRVTQGHKVEQQAS